MDLPWEWGELFLDTLIICSDLALTGTFMSVLLKMKQSRSAAGLSLQTLATLVLARTLHCFSHALSMHYQPRVAPWLWFFGIDLFNAAVGVAGCGLIVGVLYSSYEKQKDDFGIQLYQKLGLLGNDPDSPYRTALAWSLLQIAVALLALFWWSIRSSRRSFLSSYFCCFYEAMAALALIPQLWMFQKDKVVQPVMANFVVLTAISRFCTLLFWVFYPRVMFWTYPDNRGVQMASESLNILILSDFLYHWVRSKLRGEKEIYLSAV